MEHTSGKWVTLGMAVYTEDMSCIVADCDGSGDGLPTNSKTCIANARLIAAAPELLTACKDGLKYLDLMATPITGFQRENRRAFRKILTDVIAKATKQA